MDDLGQRAAMIGGITRIERHSGTRLDGSYVEALSTSFFRYLLAGALMNTDYRCSLVSGSTLYFSSCLIAGFAGASSTSEWKEALWARYSTGAPARQRRSVERYSIVKRA